MDSQAAHAGGLVVEQIHSDRPQAGYGNRHPAYYAQREQKAPRGDAELGIAVPVRRTALGWSD